MDATEGGDSSDSCSVGGVLTYSNGTSNDTETPCLLFCIKRSIQRAYINLTINLDESESGMGANSTGSCLLKTPSNMSYCCQQDLNNPEVPYVHVCVCVSVCACMHATIQLSALNASKTSE